MKYRFVITLLIIQINVYCQQRLISSSYISTYQLLIFDTTFTGKIQVVNSVKYKKDNKVRINEPDSQIFISSHRGLYDFFDTSKLLLNDMLQSVQFDLKQSSRVFIDNSMRKGRVFDTSYSTGFDSTLETILYYPSDRYFVHKLKNKEKNCTYMVRLFDKDKRLKRITYYHHGNTCAEVGDVVSHLNMEKFSEMYAFFYIVKNGVSKIASINYYRTNEKTKGKTLYASNRYWYGRNNMVQKAIFYQFNGVAQITGETLFKYSYDTLTKQ